MNVVTGILLKLVSTLLFATMDVLVRSLGHAVPVGEVVFFRSIFGIVAAILWGTALGYVMFGEIPGPLVIAGGAVVAAAGLFVIWRERQLGLKRRQEMEGPVATS